MIIYVNCTTQFVSQTVHQIIKYLTLPKYGFPFEQIAPKSHVNSSGTLLLNNTAPIFSIALVFELQMYTPKV